MVDLAALREALAGLAEKWDEHGGPYPDEAVIVAAAREFLRLMETAETVWWCEEHKSQQRWESSGTCWAKSDWIYLEGECRMVEVVLTRRNT